jgi:hypothetical protein
MGSPSSRAVRPLRFTILLRASAPFAGQPILGSSRSLFPVRTICHFLLPRFKQVRSLASDAQYIYRR